MLSLKWDCTGMLIFRSGNHWDHLIAFILVKSLCAKKLERNEYDFKFAFFYWNLLKCFLVWLCELDFYDTFLWWLKLSLRFYYRRFLNSRPYLVTPFSEKWSGIWVILQKYSINPIFFVRKWREFGGREFRKRR